MHTASLLDYLKSWPLAVLPHQLLSRGVRAITRWKTPWFKNTLINTFIAHFKVDMAEAETADAESYVDFNHFFTRALKSGARHFPVDANSVASPVDGCVSQSGIISGNRLIQAKGRNYTLKALLGGNDALVAPFSNGNFATLYLSPRDYHRIHMPCAGTLRSTLYIPGRLFSVAPHTTRAIPGLFTRNERLVCLFDTPLGPMALIMVGAIFVSCMETVWSGVVNSHRGMALTQTNYDDGVVALDRGDEMGRFNMGSTVILLFGQDQLTWEPSLLAGTPLRLGDGIGQALQQTG